MEDKFKYFPASWYPILKSNELADGELKCVSAFAGELVFFRDSERQANCVFSICPHMGTHFKGGKVNNGKLICPLHLREYGASGKCVHVPGLKDVPQNSHPSSLPVHEELGIIFVFLGSEIGFEFPTFSRAPKQKIFSNSKSYFLNTPYQALLFNGFDTHHLDCIHNRKIVVEPIFKKDGMKLTAEYSMGVIVKTFYDWLVKTLSSEQNDVYLECFGGNFLIITNKKTEDNILISSYPVDYQMSRIFLTSVTEKKNSSQMGAKLRLAITTWMGVEFLKPDIKIIEKMNPKIRNFHSSQDKGAAIFWDYWDQLPRDSKIQDLMRC